MAQPRSSLSADSLDGCDAGTTAASTPQEATPSALSVAEHSLSALSHSHSLSLSAEHSTTHHSGAAADATGSSSPSPSSSLRKEGISDASDGAASAPISRTAGADENDANIVGTAATPTAANDTDAEYSLSSVSLDKGGDGDPCNEKAGGGLGELSADERRVYERWFFAAYFAAGFGNATKVLLSTFFIDRNVRELLIGIFNSLDDIPVIFRIPFGMLSDKYDTSYGRRRPYIFVGLVLASLFYVGMGIVEGTGFSFWPFALLFMGTAWAHEVWDNQLDAYATEVTPKNRVGRIQGTIMAGSRALALLIGFGVVNFTSAANNGWVYVMLINAFLIFIPALWVFKVKEPTGRDTFQWAALNEMRRPEVMAHALFVFFGAIPTAINTVVGTLLGRHLGLSNSEVTVILVVGALVFVVGAVVIGVCIDRYRHRLRELFIVVLCFGIMALFFFTLAAATGNPSVLYGWTFCVGIAGGAVLGVNFSLMMLEVRNPVMSGSFFAIMQTIQRGGGLIGSVLSGFLVEQVDYTWTGIITMMFVVVQFPILYYMFKGVDYSTTAEITEAHISEENAKRIEVGSGGYEAASTMEMQQQQEQQQQQPASAAVAV